MLFNDIRTCVFNYGYSSGYFHPTRGIRQGCCCSPSLFVIAVELLALLVRRSINIKGLDLGNRRLKISQYADDATFFIRDFASLDALILLLTAFATVSGLHINKHKSFLLLLGHHLDPPDQYKDIQIQEQVTILGIVFKNKMTEAQHYALNFAPKLTKIKDICSTWMNRSLSMKGKALLIASLMSSILQYPCSNSFTPVRVIEEYKQIINNFFWNNKRGKVAYDLLIQNLADGGIKLPDLKHRVKTTHLYWIRQLWLHPDSVMATFLAHQLVCDNIFDVIHAKTNLAARLHKDHAFIGAVMKTWHSLHTKEPRNEDEILQERLWENDHILIQWNEIFPIQDQDREDYWRMIYLKPYKAARDTKLQAFHFRLVHRFVPCNRFLKNIRIKRDDTCSFCPRVDTLEHFLFECPVFQVFWKRVVAWFDSETDLQLNLSLRAFLFGVPDAAPQSKVINFVLLFIKFFTYRQKLFHQGSLTLIQLLQELKLRLSVEKYLNTLENKPTKFNKWIRIYMALG